MSARIPLDDEVENLGLKFVQVGEVGHDQSLAMDDGKPLGADLELTEKYRGIGRSTAWPVTKYPAA